MSDASWMAQALALAALGEGTVPPNPLVGCVVVKDGAVVGRGFHRAAGERHAECEALEQAGDRARGAALYVNLEPCAHQGRTGPCCDAIIRAGVGRVVAGIQDPNPLVNGRGFRTLRGAGIDLTVGTLEAEARSLNAPFLSSHQRGRPWVTLKGALTLDGRISAARGSSTWITSAAARRYAHRLRFGHDAVLVGAGTIRRDDPRLTARLPGVTAPRMRIVVAPRLALDPGAKVFARGTDGDPRTRLYVAATCPSSERERYRGVAEVIEVGSTPAGLDLSAVLSDLGRAGVQSVLVEGGGKTSGAFLRDALVDRVVLFIARRLFGAGEATPLLDLPAPADPEGGWRVAAPTYVPIGGDLVVAGRPERSGRG